MQCLCMGNISSAKMKMKKKRIGNCVSFSIPTMYVPYNNISQEQEQQYKKKKEVKKEEEMMRVASTSTSPPRFEKPAKDLRVLVVEDSIFLHPLYSNLLRRHGFRDITFTADPGRALKYLTSGRAGNHPAYDILFTDFMLGKCTGCEMLDLLEEEMIPKLVVLVTGLDRTDERINRTSRIHEFVGKPIKSEEFLFVCERYVKTEN